MISMTQCSTCMPMFTMHLDAKGVDIDNDYIE